MSLSAFDLFRVGIGPSSSRTVGPMRAARTLAAFLEGDGLLGEVRSVRVEPFGSLGATGHGHGSVKAVVPGLEGGEPETVDPALAEPALARVRASGTPPRSPWSTTSA
jgi:L-serine dehydratase